METFGLQSQVLQLQEYNKEWDDWVDVDLNDSSALALGAKLNVLISVPISTATEGQSGAPFSTQSGAHDKEKKQKRPVHHLPQAPSPTTRY